jgi:hypothetical protein
MSKRSLLKDQTFVAALLFASIVTFCCVALTLRQVFNSGDIMSSDGVGSFSFLSSLLLDQQLVYGDNLAVFGRQSTHWPIGAAIPWIPFFLFGHLISIVGAGVFDLPWVTSGLGYPEQLACCVGSIVYGAAAVALGYRLACRWFSPTWVLAATLLAFAAGSLPNYLLAEPYMNHGVSVFWTTLLLWIGLGETDLDGKTAVKLGVVAGLSALTRPVDGLFVMLPFLWHWMRGQTLTSLFRPLIVAAFISASIFSFQIWIWEANSSLGFIDGDVPQGFRGRMKWFAPNFRRHLWGQGFGLYSFHPVFLIATAGLLLLTKYRKTLGIVGVFGLGVQVYVISSWSGQGQSFGGRMFIASFPLFVWGLATLLEHLKAARILLAIYALPAILWNFVVLLWYRRLLEVPMWGVPSVWDP